MAGDMRCGVRGHPPKAWSPLQTEQKFRALAPRALFGLAKAA